MIDIVNIEAVQDGVAFVVVNESYNIRGWQLHAWLGAVMLDGMGDVMLLAIMDDGFEISIARKSCA